MIIPLPTLLDIDRRYDEDAGMLAKKIPPMEISSETMKKWYHGYESNQNMKNYLQKQKGAELFDYLSLLIVLLLKYFLSF